MTASDQGLIDTNIVVLLQHLDPAALPGEPVVSAVTIAELSVGPLLADDPRERATRQAHLQQAEADSDPLPSDTDPARASARAAASPRRRGRKPAARAFDALIAATAIARGIPLYTCNPGDFDGIEELDVRAVPRPPTR